jgi:predicted nucleic acid-binding protein
VIVIDTSALIDSLTGSKTSEYLLRDALERGELIILTSVVLYEWRRGLRSSVELAAQEGLFPSDDVIAFGPREAVLSAEIYRSLPRARNREIDIAIAATAILREAKLWTLNKADFRDIPNLKFTTRP